MKQVRQTVMAGLAVMTLTAAGVAGAQGVNPSVTPAPTTPAVGSITSTLPNSGPPTDPSGTTVPKITPAPPNRG